MFLVLRIRAPEQAQLIMMPARQILYITSDHSLSRTRRMVLEGAGYTVTLANDVEGALKGLRENPVFLIIIGVLTQPQIGREAMERLHQEPSSPLFLSLVSTAQLETDYTLAPMAGPEELLAVVGEAMIRSHGHSAPDGSCYMFVDGDRRYIHVTDAAAELLGYKRGELIGRRIDDIADAEMPVAEKFEEYVRDGSQTGIFHLRRGDGKSISVAYHAEVLADGCMVSQLFAVQTHTTDEPQPLQVHKIRPK